MQHRPVRTALRCLAAGVLGLALATTGCLHQDPPKAPVQPYPSLGKKTNVPDYMKGTVWELTEPDAVDPFQVTSYGLVVNLRNTGDATTAATAVRDWIVKQMLAHGWASGGDGSYKKIDPERVLADPRVAIVWVGGDLQPGARKGQRFDVQVKVMPGNNTSSLAHGTLYSTELRVNGANPIDPAGAVNVMAYGEGPIFVNPSYAFNGSSTQPGAKSSLRNGTILNGGIVAMDRPLDLRIRQPDWATSNLIVQRLNQRFQGVSDKPSTVNLNDFVVAEGQDEGYVHLYVPKRFNGDWQRFLGVATHTYINNSPDFLLGQARRLAQAAVAPGAALQDIVYCWEAIGPQALPYIRPLLGNPSPDVMFAAAEAAAFLRDPAGEQRLLDIARAAGNPFQLAAIRMLGQLPNSEAINGVLAQLLDSRDPLPRIEAYRLLVKFHDAHIVSNSVNDGAFMLDLIDSKGPPLVWASRSGDPRIAVFGHKLGLRLPMVFTAFDHQLSITSNTDQRQLVTIFDRTDVRGGARTAMCPPDLVTLIRLLAGEGPADEADAVGIKRMHFVYGDVVAVIQGLVDQKQVVEASDRRYVPAMFVMQEPPTMLNQIEEAPLPDMPQPPSLPATQPAATEAAR